MPSQSYQYIPRVAMLLCAQAALAQTNATGNLLRSDNGLPLAQAIVVAAPQIVTPGKPPKLVRAQTALDGSFFFGNLPAGDYRFCLAHLGNYLNPCEWPSKNDLGRVTLGGSDPKLRLRADPGRRVSLKLNDVSGALQRPLATGKLPEPVVLVVDRAGKIWRRILPSSTDGVTFSDLVPDDSTYGFAVGNTDLAFGDDSGKSLAAKAFIPFAPKLTPEQRASLRFMHHSDPDDPPTVVHVLGAR